MAFKISKAEQKRIDEIVQRLNSKFDDINGILEKARSEIENELVEYNEIREELRGVIEDIHAEKQEEYEDKSENWQEGDRGQATYQWLETLEEHTNAVGEDFEVEIEDIEKPDYLGTLADEGLPLEPEY